MTLLSGLRNREPQDSRVESPIGRLLNFDERAVTEFKSLYKTLDPYNPEYVNGQINERVAYFSCVQRIYAMLVSAALAFYANRSQGSSDMEVGIVMSKCMNLDESTDTIMYASTAEAFPGLLFYTMLAVGACDNPFVEMSRRVCLTTIQSGHL